MIVAPFVGGVLPPQLAQRTFSTSSLVVSILVLPRHLGRQGHLLTLYCSCVPHLGRQDHSSRTLPDR
jgi:hypothetical protein